MSRRYRLVLLATVALCVLGTAGPALAHPFGPPPTALVYVDGRTVTIDWRAAPDDAIAVGAELGLLPDELVDVYLEGPAQAAPPESAELDLTASDELRAYLVDHIRVEQDGVTCRPSVEPMDNFVHAGARTLHECPDPVSAVTITITMLHERHPAYRTFALSGAVDVDPQQAVFSVDNPRHEWDFEAERAAGGGNGLAVAWGPFALLAAAVVVGTVVVVAVTVRGGKGR